MIVVDDLQRVVIKLLCVVVIFQILLQRVVENRYALILIFFWLRVAEKPAVHWLFSTRRSKT